MLKKSLIYFLLFDATLWPVNLVGFDQVSGNTAKKIIMFQNLIILSVRTIQGLIQIRFHSGNCYWAPRFSSDMSRGILVLVYWYGHPNSAARKRKYTFLYTGIFCYRLCFFCLTITSLFSSKKKILAILNHVRT